jgi:hypothetical protein
MLELAQSAAATSFGLATILAASLVSALVFMCAGAASGSSGRLPGGDMMVGFGLVGGVLTILAVTTRMPLSWLMGVLAILSLLVPLARRTLPGGWSTWIALALALPILVRAAGTQATLWDEFWHWLPNAAYSYTHDALARRDLPPSFAQFPAYPQSMPLVVAAASRIAGRFLEAAGPVMNVALLASFAALLADSVAAMLARQGRVAPIGPIGLVALVGLTVAATVTLNPGLDGEVLLSSYADPATMVMVGGLGLLAVECLARLSGRSTDEPTEIAWRFGAVAAALINLKQSNTVLLALIMAGIGLVALFDRTIPFRRALAQFPRMLGPALVLYLVWRWYVAENLPEGEPGVRAWSEWSFSALPDMFASIRRQVFEAPVFQGMMWLITAAGLVALVRKSARTSQIGDEARWLAVITATVWLGYNAFLLLVYLAVFTEEEARSAADYWRYMPHVALLGLSVPIAALAGSTRLKLLRINAIYPVLFAVALALSALLLRGDLGITPRKRWPVFVRSVAADMKNLLPPGATVVVVLGFNANPFPIIVRYELWQLGDPSRTIDTKIVWYGADLAIVDQMLARGEVQYLLLQDAQSSVANLAAGLNVRAPEREVILFARKDHHWQELKSWPIPPAAFDVERQK